MDGENKATKKKKILSFVSRQKPVFGVSDKTIFKLAY